jgi:hypothetical protein
MDCNNYNQYYSDTLDSSGNFDSSKCFKGSEIYPKMKDFAINNYKDYKGKDYYKFINENLSEYSFPSNYADLTFNDICNSKDYSLKPQQKFAGRVFNTHVENRGILIYHGLGSGKTQTSIVIGEAFKFRKVNGQPISTVPVPGEPYNGRSQTHVLVVVPASLTEQYFSEIIGFIDSGEIKSATGQILINGERQFYLDKKIRKSLDVYNTNINRITKSMEALSPDNPKYTEYQNQLIQFNKDILFLREEENKKVNKVYEIISHERFLNQLYNVSAGPFTPGDYLIKLNSPNGLLIIDEAHRLVSAIGTSYRKLLFALNYHTNPSFKVVLLSGSPIYDKPFEFGLLINLLRPRMVFPDGYDRFNEVFIDPETKNMHNKALFKKMCSSYVSYFKGGNPEAYPYKKITVMHHSMEPYQYGIYKIALIKEIEDDQKSSGLNQEEFLVRFITSESGSDEIATSVFNNSRLYCNIAFPEVLTTGDFSRKSKAEAGLQRLREVLFAKRPQEVLSKLREFSTKFAKVAELIGKSEGPVFVYSNYVTYGVDSMAIVMSALGYSPYSRKNPSEKSYFIWKGSAIKEEVDKAKKVFNSKENFDGSKIKVMFGTQSVMEGVDFKAVRQVHILDPWWNDSRMQQVIARAIRLCSHKELPPDKRITDVFIHLSTIGSGERLFKVTYNKYLPEKDTTVVVTKQSTLVPVNITDPPNEWIYYEAVTYLDQSNQLKSIKNLSNSKIQASDIISYSQIVDPQLTRKFGGWKNLDAISVEEYMYSKALSKLNLNRQFDQVIKDSSIDCTINKNGNIIRLDERYNPIAGYENVYQLYYENYSNGKKFLRPGVRSRFSPALPEGQLTLEDILTNTAKNSGINNFVNMDSPSEVLKVNKNLILPEEINCDIVDYSFTDIPEQIVNLTINKEMVKYLYKIPINDLKRFLKDIENGKIEVSDPRIALKIKRLYSKEALTEKDQLINKFKNLGIGDEDTPWELESLESLKKLYKLIKKK